MTPTPKSMIEALGPVSLRELSGGHKLQNHAGRAAYGHLALLPSPDGAQIRYTQQCGQLRLGEAVSLTDGFDFGGAHASSPSSLRTNMAASADEWQLSSLRPITPRKKLWSAGPEISGTILSRMASIWSALSLMPWVIFHSPLSGGALPRSVGPLWGTMSSLSTEISAKPQIIFEGADK